MELSVKKRHMGLELLRIVSMAMIVLLHMLTHGGLLFIFPKLSVTGAALRLVNALVYCAVNVYALITGYTSPGWVRPGKLLQLWVHVLLIGALTTALLSPTDGKAWVTALLPVTRGEYWYFTAYFGLALLMPALHAALEKLSFRQLTAVLAGCVWLFCLASTGNKTLSLNGGYHVGWLCVLYLLGGWLRRYGREPKSIVWPLAGYFLCALLAWGWQMLAEALGLSDAQGERLLYYTSPVMLAQSVCLLLAFTRLHPKGWFGKLVVFAAPLTFGIYLLHDQPLLREKLMTMRFASFAALSAPRLALATAGAFLAIFFGCMGVEWLRTRLFALCRVGELCTRAGEALCRRLHALLPEKPPKP